MQRRGVARAAFVFGPLLIPRGRTYDAPSSQRDAEMQEDDGNTPKTKVQNKYWGRQIDAIVGEISKLAVACDVDVLDPNVVLQCLRGDESACKRKNPAAFKRIHELLMLLFTVSGKSLDRMGDAEFASLAGPVLDKIRALRGAKK
jgi:hypothetical protein